MADMSFFFSATGYGVELSGLRFIIHANGGTWLYKADPIIHVGPLQGNLASLYSEPFEIPDDEILTDLSYRPVKFWLKGGAVFGCADMTFEVRSYDGLRARYQFNQSPYVYGFTLTDYSYVGSLYPLGSVSSDRANGPTGRTAPPAKPMPRAVPLTTP
jgi:hypothetical protein